MDSIDNNQFEVKPVNSKRKITAPLPNVYLNPALDLLVNDDPMVNTAMEIVPSKKRKHTKSSDVATFENNALDLGVNKVPVNEFLVRELDNVCRNVKNNSNNGSNITATSNNEISLKAADVTAPSLVFQNLSNRVAEPIRFPFECDISYTTKESHDVTNQEMKITAEPIYSNLPDRSNEKCLENTIDTLHSTDISRIPHEDFDVDSGISVLEQKPLNTLNNISNISNITNIQTNITNQVLINNSNLSLSFIDRLALDSPNMSDRSLYLDDDLNESNIMEIKTITIITKKKRIIEKKNTNPFLDPNLNTNDVISTTNPFLDIKPELEYQEETLSRPIESQAPNGNVLMPRRLFSGDTNSTISTMNESSIESQHDYENIESLRSESPIYENIEDAMNYNKQSKILGYDVSQLSAVDIMNKGNHSHSNDSHDSKKEKSSFLKVGNKLSKKVFKTLKKKFKHEKHDTDTTLNPYEVPRKPPKQKTAQIESGIENPALNLDNSDDIEISELSDEEHQYETIKTRRNTQLNMNVTPLKARENDIDFIQNKSNTPGKKVRFDSTLNQEKIITGNSFDYDLQSPGFDAKIDKYHDELENCINERKFLQQNM